MKPQAVELLRLILPPLKQPGIPLRAFYYLKKQWHRIPDPDLNQLARDYPSKKRQIALHPADLSLSQQAFPPLSRKKYQAAARAYVQLHSLGDIEQQSVGHSPAHQGLVCVAWTDHLLLQQWQHTLRAHRLMVSGFYPPTAFLPWNGHTQALALDNWLLVRTGSQHGLILPTPAAEQTEHTLESYLQHHYPQCLPVNLLEPLEPALTGSGPDWKWQLSPRLAVSRTQGWLKPALAWACASGLVSLLGLQAYAQQLEEQGKQLKQQMQDDLKRAYPQISVVLNPLQQARQMGENPIGPQPRQNGGASLNLLLQRLAPLLPAATAQIDRLQYRENTLTLHWRAGSALATENLPNLQAQAQKTGLHIETQAQPPTWTITLAQPQETDNTQAPP